MAEIEDESGTTIQDEAEAIIEDQAIGGQVRIGAITLTGESLKQAGFNRNQAGIL